MTKSRVQTALDDLRVAADVCELDENAIVVRQATRIRAARLTLAQAIEAQRAETVKQGSVADESAVAISDAPIVSPHSTESEGE